MSGVVHAKSVHGVVPPTLDLLSRAHVEYGAVYRSTTYVSGGKVRSTWMFRGVGVDDTVSSPSCPRLLSPQQNTSPLTLRVHTLPLVSTMADVCLGAVVCIKLFVPFDL